MLVWACTESGRKWNIQKIYEIVENKRTTWCYLLFLFQFLCAQHVADINISIIRNLRLFFWFTTLVVCSWFDVCWSFGVVGLEWYPCCRLKPTWCHLLFYFTSYVLHMLRTLIYPSSGAYDYSFDLPHWSCVLCSMCVGVSVWLCWSGIRVAGFSLQHGYHSNTTTCDCTSLP